MTVSVRCAVLTVGCRNALTPLLTASTPVMAVHPLANDRTRLQRPTASAAAGGGGGATTGTGWPPLEADLTIPVTRMPAMLAMNRYVGTAKANPASPVPRRFATV